MDFNSRATIMAQLLLLPNPLFPCHEGLTPCALRDVSSVHSSLIRLGVFYAGTSARGISAHKQMLRRGFEDTWTQRSRTQTVDSISQSTDARKVVLRVVLVLMMTETVGAWESQLTICC